VWDPAIASASKRNIVNGLNNIEVLL